MDRVFEITPETPALELNDPNKGIILLPLVNLAQAQDLPVKPPYKPDSAAVKAYVAAEAKKVGVNPIVALFILQHESQNCQRLVGPEPNGSTSYGCWQFNDRNADFDYDCVMDMKCATKTALQWILDGKIMKWTAWRERCELYPKEYPPNCA